MTTKGMLFDTSPVDDPVSATKKKPSKRKKPEQSRGTGHVAEPVHEEAIGFLAQIDGHYTCETCGLTLLDLVEIRKVDGKEKWLVSCGWWCMRTWLVDPVPGLLEKEDAKTDDGVYRIRGGLFDGKTFDEISVMPGGCMYIESLVKLSKRSSQAAAAAEWLTAKKA